ncbi:hypothetical protein RQP46_006459 [Phenoliferia psychrophenolica]
MAPPRAQCRRCDETKQTCDRALPACSPCRLAGDECSFAVAINWDTRNSDTLVLAPSRRYQASDPQRSLTLVPDASTLQRSSLAHFVQSVSPSLVAIEGLPKDNPNLFYLPLALSPTRGSNALLHALVAAGSAHQRNWGVQIDPAAIKKHETQALAQLEKDLMTLAGRLVHGGASDGELVRRVNEALATAQVLILYSTTVGDTKLWRKHLSVAAGLLSEVVNIRAREGKPPLRLNRFLVEMLRYSDVQGALSSQTATIISPDVMVDEWPPDQLVAASSATLINGKTSALSSSGFVQWHKKCNLGVAYPSPPESIDEFDSRAVDIEPRVADEIARIRRDLDECRANLHRMASDPAVQKAFQTRLLRPDQLEGQLCFADSIYYSCHVYISRTLETGGHLRGAALGQVYAGLDVIARVPFDASSNLLSWSLVVVGCELFNDEPARAIVRARLKALEALGHLNFNQTRILVEEVWRRKDLWRPGETVVTWQGVMKDLDWDVFIV